MFFLKKRKIVLKFEEHPRLKEIKFSLNKIVKSPLSIIGLTLIFIYLMIALFAPVIAPPKYEHEPFRIPFHRIYTDIPGEYLVSASCFNDT